MNQTATNPPTAREKWVQTAKEPTCQSCQGNSDKAIIHQGNPVAIPGHVCPGCLRTYCWMCSLLSLEPYTEDNEWEAWVCLNCFFIQLEKILNGHDIDMEILQTLAMVHVMKDVKDKIQGQDLLSSVLKALATQGATPGLMTGPVPKPSLGNLTYPPGSIGAKKEELVEASKEVVEEMAKEAGKTLLEIFQAEDQLKAQEAHDQAQEDPKPEPELVQYTVPWMDADFIRTLKDAEGKTVMDDLLARVRNHVAQGETVMLTEGGEVKQVIHPDGLGGIGKVQHIGEQDDE